MVVRITVTVEEEVACLSSTMVMVMMFSPEIKLMSSEKLPDLSDVVRISSLSEIMAMFTLGLVVPLRVSWASVTTELSGGKRIEIRLSGFFEEEGVTFEVPFSVSVLP